MVSVELDGGIHNKKEQKEYDHARTEFLMEQGITELRFTNEEVFDNILDVLDKIKIELNRK